MRHQGIAVVLTTAVLFVGMLLQEPESGFSRSTVHGPRSTVYKPAAAPLMTPWAKDVSPDKVWPEYPRPQMVRKDWVNLNGLWDYAIVPISPVPDASGHKNDGNSVGLLIHFDSAGPSGGGAWSFGGAGVEFGSGPVVILKDPKDFDKLPREIKERFVTPPKGTDEDVVHIPRVVQDDFTISLWVKTDQKGGEGNWYNGIGLVDGDVPGVQNDFGTALVGNVFCFGVGNPDVSIKSNTAINDNRWHHVTAVRSRSTGAIQVFVDGKLEASGTGGKQSLSAPTGLTIGKVRTGRENFTGYLTDVRIYQRTLSADEIATLQRSPGKKTANEAGLVGWWRLEGEVFTSDWVVVSGLLMPGRGQLFGAGKAPPTWPKVEGKILVPFCVESALSGVRRQLTPQQLLIYKRTFTPPKLEGGKRLLLHFGAVDWQTRVYVNGKLVGEHVGGYDSFSFDITDAIKPGAENEIVVVVFDPTNGTRGKQHLGSMFNPGGIMYTPCSGIWQTVWLEAVPACRIEELQISPDVDAGVLRLKVIAKGAAKEQVEAVALQGDREIAKVTGQPGTDLVLPIKNARLWSPDDPFLYDLKVKIGRDEVASYFGMRKISLGKDAKGIQRILLNSKFVFQVGVLDQGFWPDGIYTAPTDEALRFDVAKMRELGLNMARKHVKVEPQRWYYWCDKLGLLVWQDMPSGDLAHTEKGKTDGVANSPEVGKQFEAELKALVEQHRNHPSIIMWVVFNEGWGQHDTVRLMKWVKDLDPSRLVNNASGWHDRKCGDVVDMHNYPGPGSPKPEPSRAAVLGEFGGLGMPIPGHVWTEKNWSYKGSSSQAALTRSYVELLRKAWKLKDDPGLCAVVYTQWTDVEAECNGLLTYDRKVVKMDAKQLKDAHRGKFAP